METWSAADIAAMQAAFGTDGTYLRHGSTTAIPVTVIIDHGKYPGYNPRREDGANPVGDYSVLHLSAAEVSPAPEYLDTVTIASTGREYTIIEVQIADGMYECLGVYGQGYV